MPAAAQLVEPAAEAAVPSRPLAKENQSAEEHGVSTAAAATEAVASSTTPTDSPAAATDTTAVAQQQLKEPNAAQLTSTTSSPTHTHTQPGSTVSHLPRSPPTMPRQSPTLAHMRTVSAMFKPTSAPAAPPNYHLSFLRLLLQRFPLLTGMHPDSLDDLAHHTRRLATHRGQTIAAEGDAPTCVYLIENGTYKLSKLSDQLWDDAADEYMQVTLAQLSGGEEIGTFSLIAAAKEQVKAIMAARSDEGQAAFRKPPPPSFPPHPLTTTCTAPGHVYAVPLLPLLALTTSRPSLLRHLSTDVLLHHAVHMRRFEGAEQYKMEHQGAVDEQFVDAVRDAAQLQGTRADRHRRLPRPRTKRPKHVTVAVVKEADVTWQEEEDDEQKDAAEVTAEDKRQKEKEERRRRRKEARQKREAAKEKQQADNAAIEYRTADEQQFAARAEKEWRKDERAVEAEEKEALREEMKRRWAEGQRQEREDREMAELLSKREKKFSERDANQQPIMLKRQEEQERYAVQRVGSPRSHLTPFTQSDEFEQHLQRMHSREAHREQQSAQEQPDTPQQQQPPEEVERDARGRKSFVSSTIALINSIARENHLTHIVHPRAQQRPHRGSHTRLQHKNISWNDQATHQLIQQTAAADGGKQIASAAAVASSPEQSVGDEGRGALEETEEEAERRLSTLSQSSFDPLSHLHLVYSPQSASLLHPTLPDGSINPELIRTVEAGNEVFRLSDMRRSSLEAPTKDGAAIPATSFFEGADVRESEGQDDGSGNGRSLTSASAAAGMSPIMKGALSYAHIGARSRGATLNDDAANSNLRALREKRMSAMQAAMGRGEKVLAAAGLIQQRQQRQQDADGSFFVTDQQGEEGAGGSRASVEQMRQVSSLLSDPLALASMLTSSSAADRQMGNDEQGERLQNTIQHSQHNRQGQAQPSASADSSSQDAAHMSAAEYLRHLYTRHGLHLVQDIADMMVRERLGQRDIDALDASIAGGGVLSSKVQAMLIEAVAAVEAEMKRVEDIRAARRPIVEEGQEDEEQRRKVAEKAERKQRRQAERVAKAQEMEARLTAEVTAQLAAKSELSSPTSKQQSPMPPSPRFITPTAFTARGQSSDRDTSATETETEADTATEGEDETKTDKPRTMQPPPRMTPLARLPMPAPRMPTIQPRQPPSAVDKLELPTPQPTTPSLPATTPKAVTPRALPAAIPAQPATQEGQSQKAIQPTLSTSTSDSSPQAVTPVGSAIEQHPLHAPSLPSSVVVVAASLPSELLSAARDEPPSRQQTAPDRFISTPATNDDAEEDEDDIDQQQQNDKAADSPRLNPATASPLKRSSRAQAQFDVHSVAAIADEAEQLQQQPVIPAEHSEVIEASAGPKSTQSSQSTSTRSAIPDSQTADTTVPSTTATSTDELTASAPDANDTSNADETAAAALPPSMPPPTTELRSPALEATFLLGENVSVIRTELKKSIADETVKLKEVLEGEEREKAEQARQEERRRRRREAAEAVKRERAERKRRAAEEGESRQQLQAAAELAKRQAREADEQQKAMESFHASRPPSEQQERPDTAVKESKLQSFDTTKPHNDTHDGPAHKDETKQRAKGKTRKKGRLAAMLSPRLGTAPSAYSPVPDSPRRLEPQSPADDTSESEEGDVEERHQARVHAVRAEVMAELIHLFGAEVRHHLLEKAVQKAAAALEEKRRERRKQLKQKHKAETAKQRGLQAIVAAKQAMLTETQRMDEEGNKLLEEEDALKRVTEQRLHQLEEEKVAEDDKHKHDEERKKAQAERMQRDNEKLQEERKAAKEARAKRREEKMRRRITQQLKNEQAEANRAAFSRLTSPTAKRSGMLKSPGMTARLLMSPSSRASQGLASQRRVEDGSTAGDTLLPPSAAEEEKMQWSEQADGGDGDIQLQLHHRSGKRQGRHRSPARSSSRSRSHSRTGRRNNRHQSHDPSSPHHSDEAEHEDDSFLSRLRTEQDWIHFNPLHPSFNSPDGHIPFDDFDCTAIIDDLAQPSAVLSGGSGGLLPATWYTFVYRDAPATLVARLNAAGVYEYEADEVSEEEREKQRKKREVKEREQEEDDAIRHSIERRGSLQAYETRQREVDTRTSQHARRKKEKEERELQEARMRDELDRQSAQQQQDEMNAFAEAAAKEQQTLSLLLAAPPTAAVSGDSHDQQSAREAEEVVREVAMLESAHERLRLRDVSYLEREQREAVEQAAELSALDLSIREALDDVQQQRDQQRYPNTQFLPSLTRSGLGSRDRETETGRRQYSATTAVSSTTVVRSTSPSQQSHEIGGIRSPLASRPASSAVQPLTSDSVSRGISLPDGKQPIQSPKAVATSSSTPSYQQRRVSASSILSSHSTQLLNTMSPAASASTLGSAQLATLPNSMRVALTGQMPFAKSNTPTAAKPKRGSFIALDPLTPSKRSGK